LYENRIPAYERAASETSMEMRLNIKDFHTLALALALALALPPLASHRNFFAPPIAVGPVFAPGDGLRLAVLNRSPSLTKVKTSNQGK
jgi:hypothetical protein